LTANYKQATRSPATFLKVFHEGPGPTLSRYRRNMCRCLWHTPKIFRKFAQEWRFDL